LPFFSLNKILILEHNKFYVEAKQILNFFQFKLKFIDNYLGWL